MSLSREETTFQLGLHELRAVDYSQLREDQSRQLKSYEEFIQRSLASFSENQKATVYFEITDSKTIIGKAFSSRVGDEEIRIATVSAGAFLYFHEFFSYVMSRLDILPWIGSVYGERNFPHKFIPTRKYSGIQALIDRRLVADINPRCPLRLEFAQIMAVTACQFMAWHEIGHCVDGHISQLNFEATEDVQSARSMTPHTLRNHTLEMDADAYALCWILHTRVIPELNGKTDFRWSSKLSDFPPNKLLYPTLLAINLTFRLLADPETLPLDRATLLQGTHPHPWIRSHLCRVNVSSQAHNLYLESDEDLWLTKMATRSIYDAAQIWECITGAKEPIRLLYLDDFSVKDGFRRVNEYMHSLLDCWHEIRPQLNISALVPLAPSRHDASVCPRCSKPWGAPTTPSL
jgi:hypothetical protein